MMAAGDGHVIVGGPRTVQVKVLLSDRVPSDALAVTVYVPALGVARVPEMSPVVALTVSAGGSPVALYVNASLSGSLATSCNETVQFSSLVWFTGAVSVGAPLMLATVQVKVLLSDRVPSDAVAVTL